MIPPGLPIDKRSTGRRRRGVQQRQQISKVKAVLKLLEGKKVTR